MPVIDRESGRRVVNDRLGEVVDAPGVVTVLVVEPLAHRQMLVEPLAAMPLADKRGEIAGVAQRLGDRAFARVERVNPAGRLAALCVRKRQAERLQIAGLAEILRAPVHPVAERVAPGEERSTRRRADGVGVELRQAQALRCEAIDARRQFLLSAVESRLRPSHVVGQHEDDIRATALGILRRSGHTCHSKQYDQTNQGASRRDHEVNSIALRLMGETKLERSDSDRFKQGVSKNPASTCERSCPELQRNRFE